MNCIQEMPQFRGPPSYPSASEPRVDGVADAFAQQVVAQHRDQDGHAREEREPPRNAERALAEREDVAPAGRGRLHPDAQERERRLHQHGRRDP